MSTIKHVVLDFDGTCTQIPVIHKHFLKQFREELNMPKITEAVWHNAQEQVRFRSPTLGWTVKTTPSAPAAADPYILAGEAAKYAYKIENITTDVPMSAFNNSYAAHPAPWRVEALEVIKKLLQQNVSIHFVSNSSKQVITQRMTDLWGGSPLPEAINFYGNAAKYSINEPDWQDLADWPEWLKIRFNDMPAVVTLSDIGRPVYLRRGSFASIIASIFNTGSNGLSEAVFCGDVWELDLALPAALGANIHLVERAYPFDTCKYEYTTVKDSNGKVSPDLKGLLDWL